MKKEDISNRVQQLINLADTTLRTHSGSSNSNYTNYGKFAEFRVSVLSFLSMVYDDRHPHYKDFDRATGSQPYRNSVHKGKGILLAVQNEINEGWIFSVKRLISAEIFSDFLEMADYLLDSGYKDPAAVMIGSVLESNIRQLCIDNSIITEAIKDNNVIFIKADKLNSDLAKASIYTKLDQKNVTAWLDLRNNAAHGNYDKYTEQQVRLMFQGVCDFLVRVSN